MAGIVSHLSSVQREKTSQVNNQSRQEGKELEGKSNRKNYSNWAELMTPGRIVQREGGGGGMTKRTFLWKDPSIPLYTSKPSPSLSHC